MSQNVSLRVESGGHLVMPVGRVRGWAPASRGSTKVYIAKSGRKHHPKEGRDSRGPYVVVRESVAAVRTRIREARQRAGQDGPSESARARPVRHGARVQALGYTHADALMAGMEASIADVIRVHVERAVELGMAPATVHDAAIRGVLETVNDFTEERQGALT